MDTSTHGWLRYSDGWKGSRVPSGTCWLNVVCIRWRLSTHVQNCGVPSPVNCTLWRRNCFLAGSLCVCQMQLVLYNDEAYITLLTGGRLLCTMTPCQLNTTSSGSKSALEDTILQLFGVPIAATCALSSCMLLVSLLGHEIC